jgi:hypothetical protein
VLTTHQRPTTINRESTLPEDEHRLPGDIAEDWSGPTGDGRRPVSLVGLPVALILAFYFVISTLYNFAVPVGEAPDEPSHVDYVQIMLRTGQLPTIPKGSARYSYEAEQPPLY